MAKFRNYVERENTNLVYIDSTGLKNLLKKSSLNNLYCYEKFMGNRQMTIYFESFEPVRRFFQDSTGKIIYLDVNDVECFLDPKSQNLIPTFPKVIPPPPLPVPIATVVLKKSELLVYLIGAIWVGVVIGITAFAFFFELAKLSS